MATKEREEIKGTTKQKTARRQSKKGGNHLEQESNRQKTMEVEGYSLQWMDIVCLLVGWLLNVPATCECISGTDLHRHFSVLPH